jgi:hypothetical protein
MNANKDLGLALVNCAGWSWLPGMLLVSADGVIDRVLKVRKYDGWVLLASDGEDEVVEWYNPKGSYPDIHDPATFGCIFSLLKFRMKEPTLHLTPDKDGWYVNKLSLDGPEWYCGNGTWGLEDCYSPFVFSSQQEAVVCTFISLYEDSQTIH